MTDDFSWARSAPAVAVREAIAGGILGPLMDLYTRRRIAGRESLERVPPPVIFVANHASHMDAPAILRALPRNWRRRTAMAAAADYFYRKPLRAFLVSLAFNTVAVARRGERAQDATSELGALIAGGWSLVIFAEGTRSRDGNIGRLHSGAAVLAAQHDLPIVPVYVRGTHAVMPPGRRWMSWARGGLLPRRRPIEVRFGPPIRPRAGEHRTDVMERVRLFFHASGAITTPDKRVLAARRRSATV
ncbi:MAG TPA: lysophospholipid acyltransferase family protein [Thermoleophilaceae bacterium]|nr:lysophospholipid acyltransferase family protein [Thermoleophilaceae bacterium]